MKNLFAATYAPMEKDFKLNLSIINDYADYLKTNKVAGVFTNGSTGDFASLDVAERKALVTEWAKNKSDDLYLINHVGHTSLKSAMELAEHAADKADAISAIAPFYFLPSNLEKLLEYCEKIAGKAPALPFYYYHLPALTGVNFSMLEFSKAVKKRIPNFAGIKFTENNIVEFKKLKAQESNLNIYFGVDEAFLPSLSVGADGWVGSTYNHLMPLYTEIHQAFVDRDLEKANKLQALAISFVETLGSFGGFNGTGKSFMRHLGIDCGPSRFPHVTLNSADLQKAVDIFHENGTSDYYGVSQKQRVSTS